MKKALCMAAFAAFSLAGCSSGSQAEAKGVVIDEQALFIGIEKERDGMEVRLELSVLSPFSDAFDYDVLYGGHCEIREEIGSSDEAFQAMDGQSSELVFLDVASFLSGRTEYEPWAYWSAPGVDAGMGIAVRTAIGEDEEEIVSDYCMIDQGGIYSVGLAEVDGAPCQVDRENVWRYVE